MGPGRQHTHLYVLIAYWEKRESLSHLYVLLAYWEKRERGVVFSRPLSLTVVECVAWLASQSMRYYDLDGAQGRGEQRTRPTEREESRGAQHTCLPTPPTTASSAGPCPPRAARRQAGPLPGLVLGAGAPLARRGGRVPRRALRAAAPRRRRQRAASDFTPPQQARGTAARARRLLCPEYVLRPRAWEEHVPQAPKAACGLSCMRSMSACRDASARSQSRSGLKSLCGGGVPSPHASITRSFLSFLPASPMPSFVRGSFVVKFLLMVRSSPESNWQPLAPRRRGVAT